MVPIPEGSESYSEESDYTDYGDSQEFLDQPGDLLGSGGSTEDADPNHVRDGKIHGACELSG